jgi:hypothetical protein
MANEVRDLRARTLDTHPEHIYCHRTNSSSEISLVVPTLNSPTRETSSHRPRDKIQAAQHHPPPLGVNPRMTIKNRGRRSNRGRSGHEKQMAKVANVRRANASAGHLQRKLILMSCLQNKVCCFGVVTNDIHSS